MVRDPQGISVRVRTQHTRVTRQHTEIFARDPNGVSARVRRQQIVHVWKDQFEHLRQQSVELHITINTYHGFVTICDLKFFFKEDIIIVFVYFCVADGQRM